MKKILFGLFLVVGTTLGAVLISPSIGDFVPKAMASRQEPEGQVLGFYSKGKIRQATSLPEVGVGFVHLFRDRNRHFASQGMIDLLIDSSAQFSKLYPTGERLQIGDIAAEKGGFISGHASHQNGLDVDLVYFRTNHEEQDPSYPNGFREVFVKNGKVTPNFDVQRNFEWTRLLVRSGRVTRIFMDPVIKKAFCAYAKKSGSISADAKETLRRIRPYAAHDNHMHVRISCPAQSPGCEPQEEVAQGTGCDTIDFEMEMMADPQAELESEE